MTAVSLEPVQTPALVERLMAPTQQRLIGIGNALADIVALVALVWTYGLAEQMVAAQEGTATGEIATRTISWWGPSFSITLATSLVVVGAAAGFVGSVVQQSIVFASRAGQQTLERGYLWWYVLRPVWSALLGGVVVLTVNAGLVSIGDDTTSAAGVTVLVTAAAVAGLFTDQAMQRLRSVLGASDPSTLTTDQPTPEG